MTVTTFSIASDADDGGGHLVKLTWPTAGGTFGDDEGSTTIYIDRSLYGADYYLTDGFLRWDTSSIPDTDVITAAQLEIFIKENPNVDAPLNFMGQYFDFGGEPVIEADLVDDNVFDAFSVAMSTLQDETLEIIPFSDLSGISKVGFTGLRLKISQLAANAAPTGANEIGFASFNAPVHPEPKLVVTHSEPSVTPAVAWWVA